MILFVLLVWLLVTYGCYLWLFVAAGVVSCYCLLVVLHDVYNLSMVVRLFVLCFCLNCLLLGL